MYGLLSLPKGHWFLVQITPIPLAVTHLFLQYAQTPFIFKSSEQRKRLISILSY